jgi:intracellular proteinase inhibitor BsuPI
MAAARFVSRRDSQRFAAHPARHRDMNRRLIFSLLCAGALAFACGPRNRTQTPALASALSVTPVGAATHTTPRAHDKRGRDETKFDSHLMVKVAKRTARFALNVKNVGRKHVEIRFPNGQVSDFAVLDSAGREVWRWSTGRMFTQGVQNKFLGTGESVEADAAWNAGAKPGHYTVVATLNSANYPAEQRSEFDVP